MGHRDVPSRAKYKMEESWQPWSSAEILHLIEIWSDDSIQGQLDGLVRNKKVFVRIAAEMECSGYCRNFQQCRNKIKSLKAEYKKVKDNNNR